MAVIAPAAADTLQVGQPSLRSFVRLKLRIIGNGMRGSGWRIALFILGILAGLWGALMGFGMFLAASFAGDLREVYATFAGTAIVLAWTLLPLLFFGVDETLDPARFALLPISRRRLAQGMFVAACVGIAPIATLVAALGATVGAASDGGAAAAAVAVVGAVLGLLVCVVASRAVTSAFAGMLRARRTRDMAAVVIAVLGVSCGPMQGLMWGIVSQGDTREASAVAEVLGWTPLAAPFVAYSAAVDGRWVVVAARLAIGVAGIALLLWWWSRTIEAAMLGASSGSGSRAGRARGDAAGTPDGPMRTFLLRPLFWLPTNRFGALVTREIRYWWRDPRRRAGLISLALVALVIPFTSVFGGAGGFGGPGPSGVDQSSSFPLSIPVAMSGILIGLVLANQFGNDGPAYAAHLLADVPGQVELRARSAGLAIITGPLIVVGSVAAALLGGMTAQLPQALGSAVAAFGISLGLSSVISVLAPFALPEGHNPFAMPSGGAMAKSLMSLAGMLAAAALTVPVVLAALVLPEDLRWLVLPVGIGYGVGAAALATYIAGDLLDRRAPEVLAAVTSRR